MAETAGSSLLNIRNAFSRSSVEGASIRGEDTVNKREFVQQSQKFVETQQKDQQSLSSIQQQITNLQSQINALSVGLNQVRSLIQKDTVSEQNLLRQEQNAESKYTQRKIRLGNENELEQKIQSALTAPVQQAAAKVENIFGKIGQALTSLFLGWLGVQGVKALKANADKDYDALVDIKNNVIKNIGLAVAAVASIKLGLGLVSRAITGVVGKVGSIIANIIKAPFKVVGAAASGLGSMLSGGGNKPPTSAGPGAAPPRVSPPKKPNIIQRAAGAASKALTAVGGVMDLTSGQFTDAALAGAALKGPGIVKPIAGAIYGVDAIAEMFGGNIFGKNPNQPQTQQAVKPPAAQPQALAIPTASKPGDNKPPTVVSSTNNQKNNNITLQPAPEPKENSSAPFSGEIVSDTLEQNVTPQVSMMPSSSDLTLNVNEDKSQKENDYWKSEAKYWDTIAKGLEAGSTYEELGLNQEEIDYLEGKTDKPPFLADKKIPMMEVKPTELTGEMMETKPISTPSIPPLQEPAPNVTIASAPQQQQKTAIPSSTGTDVPFIPSANPDNFYVLYSKLNYNVVA
jgi:hypothetical protein